MTFDESLLTLAERPDPRRFVADLYPTGFRTRFRLDDVDFNGHINNVATSVLHQESRATLLHRLWPPVDGVRSVQLAVAQYVSHYLAEAYYPGEAQCCAGVARIGTSSVAIATALFVEDRCFSVADTVLVIRRDGVVDSLSEDDRTALMGFRLTPAD